MFRNSNEQVLICRLVSQEITNQIWLCDNLKKSTVHQMSFLLKEVIVIIKYFRFITS